MSARRSNTAASIETSGLHEVWVSFLIATTKLHFVSQVATTYESIPQWLRKIAVAIAAGVLFWLVIIMIFEEQMIYFPAKYPEGYWQTEGSGVKVEDCSFTTEDGMRLHGWFSPADGAELTLLWAHGNAGNITHRLENLRLLHDLGINVFIFD